jgi:hypothetical protein
MVKSGSPLAIRSAKAAAPSSRPISRMRARKVGTEQDFSRICESRCWMSGWPTTCSISALPKVERIAFAFLTLGPSMDHQVLLRRR